MVLFGLIVIMAVAALAPAEQSETSYSGLTGMEMAKMLATAVKQDPTSTMAPSRRLSETKVVTQLVQGKHRRAKPLRPKMKRVLLRNSTTALCNDRSPAGYYIRKSPGSRRWLIFLEGGWYCFDGRTCLLRWGQTNIFMSSKRWQEYREEDGILSVDSVENPHFWNANIVFVPYCSSDGWTGKRSSPTEEGFVFMGSVIIQNVIEDLFKSKGLNNARMIFLAGSSAGGAGVFLNVDRVTDHLRSVGFRGKVRGIADSAWFMDNEPFEKHHICSDVQNCEAVVSLRAGLEYWNSQLPERCTQEYPRAEHWKCYFPYRIYPTLQTPTFVIQWLVDEAQIAIDNVGTPMGKSQWAYIYKNMQRFRESLQNVTALYVPSCISHTILTKADWGKIRIHNRSLPEALRCWESQAIEYNHYHQYQEHELHDKMKRPRAERGNIRKRRKNRRSRRGRKRKASEAAVQSRLLRVSTEAQPAEDAHYQHRWRYHDNLCEHRLVDDCDFPHCNMRCPPLKNPYTGENVQLADLLRSFGLDLNQTAKNFGMNLSQFYGMGHDTLLGMLNSHYTTTES